MTSTAHQPGWYRDPASPEAALRYFDGHNWTERTAPRGGGEHPGDAAHWMMPTGRSWQSITAGYLALFTVVFFFLAPVTLGIGIWAMTVAKRDGTHGRGRAIFAIVVSALWIIAALALWVFN